MASHSSGRRADDRYLRQTFRRHSRTFSLATRLLPRAVRLPVATLYLLCRSIDDIADREGPAEGADRALAHLDAMEQGLDATLAGHPPEALLWQRLAEVHTTFPLARAPLQQLLDGARWDLQARPIRHLDDLAQYADLVAGSVGAMMLPFLLADPGRRAAAEAPARALGVAMQLTNIIRDVGEDCRTLSRIYLPADALLAAGLAPEDLEGPTVPPAYPTLIESVMARAEAGYAQGLAGLKLLPRASRAGIRAAARCYREIHNEVRARGYDNLTQRAYVPLPRKLRLLAQDDYRRRRDRLRAQTDASSHPNPLVRA